jgi:acyl-CoA synthetase (AMP-forming)/AMP-acid ligase II
MSMGVNIRRHMAHIFEDIVARFPDREALVFYGTRITFGQWNARANALATKLEELGIEKGDRVSLLLPPVPDFLIAAMGVAKLGAITVPTNPLLQPGEMITQLKDVGSKALIMMSQFMGRDFAAILDEARPELPDLQHVIARGPEHEGYLPLDAIYAAPVPERKSFVREGLTDEDPVVILYSGGTTGLPKGVPRDTYGLFYSYAPQAAYVDENDAMLLVPPLFMAAGFLQTVYPVLFGAKLVGMPAFNPTTILQTIQDEKCTLMFAYPTMMRWILGQPDFDQFDVSSMRLVFIGGEAVTTEMIKTIQAKFGCKTQTGYGMTETTGTTVTPLDAPPELIAGSDGQVLSEMEVRLVDEEGKDVPFGEAGEIIVRGRPVFRGYWNRPHLNAEVFTPDGFFHTGDLVRYINDQGYIRVVGRAKDTIRRSAMTIYPDEVENAIKMHPKVAQAGVIGVPSAVSGERVRAYVQLHPGQEMTPVELMDHLRTKLAAYKLPDEVRFLAEVPMSSVRRVRRVMLREEARRELELEQAGGPGR